MTTETPPAWSLAMARSEMGFDIAAGSLAIDPIAAEGLPENDNAEESRLALSRFVTLMRRKEGISIEALTAEIEGLRKALEEAPIIGLRESGEEFKSRQDNWLKTKAFPALGEKP